MTTTSAAPQRWAYPMLLVLLAVALGVSGVPAPLYGVYAQDWGFAPLTTTIVFAAYAVAALVAVLVTGAVSDRFGRRPVLLVAVVLVLVGLGLFMAADSVAWLVAARTLHGFAVGAIVVAGSAALLDLRPDEGEASGRRAGIAFNIGIALTILDSAVLVDLGPAPMVTPYVAVAALGVVLLVGVLLMRETHQDQRTTSLHVARPRVPAAIRGHFRFAALGVMASWSVLGVFLSLFPTIAARAVGTDGVLFGGAAVAASAAAAALSQVVGARWPARSAAIVGDLGTGASLLLAIPAVAWGHAWAIAVTATLIGFFFGLAFGSSLRHLGSHVPPAHRGEVMSAFYVLAYSALALPTLVAGWAASTWSPEAVFGPFMACVATACVVAAVLGMRMRDDDPAPAVQPVPVRDEVACGQA